ncbi:MAG: hypothetical protein AABX11_07510 [Nanoarchaeota archaeon]
MNPRYVQEALDKMSSPGSGELARMCNTYVETAITLGATKVTMHQTPDGYDISYHFPHPNLRGAVSSRLKIMAGLEIGTKSQPSKREQVKLPVYTLDILTNDYGSRIVIDILDAKKRHQRKKVNL